MLVDAGFEIMSRLTVCNPIQSSPLKSMCLEWSNSLHDCAEKNPGWADLHILPTTLQAQIFHLSSVLNSIFDGISFCLLNGRLIQGSLTKACRNDSVSVNAVQMPAS